MSGVRQPPQAIARAARARARGKPKPPLTARDAAKKGDLSALKAAAPSSEPANLSVLLSVTVGSARESKAKQYAEVATFLIDAGADPNGRRMPMLCLAAGAGVPDLVRLLFEAGAASTVYTAACLGDIDTVQNELTLRPGIATEVDESGRTAVLYCATSKLGHLDEAVERRLAQVAEVLLDHGADSEASPRDSMPPLTVAAAHSGNQPLVELFLERGLKPPDHLPLQEALRTMKRQGDRYSRICDVLLAHGEYDLAPILTGQARHEDIQATIWLLARGADPSRRLKDGRTTLHLSADRNSGTRVVGLLLDHGAEINARDDLDHTPLFYARQSEKTRIVEFLLSRGAQE